MNNSENKTLLPIDLSVPFSDISEKLVEMNLYYKSLHSQTEAIIKQSEGKDKKADEQKEIIDKLRAEIRDLHKGADKFRSCS